MNGKTALLTAIAITSLSACDDVPSPVEPDLVPNRAASLFTVEEWDDVRSESRTPISTVMNNPCTGEEVVLTGELHTIFRESVDEDGATRNRINIHTHDLEGVAVNTLRKYKAFNQFRFETETPPPAFEFDQLVEDRMSPEDPILGVLANPDFSNEDFRFKMRVRFKSDLFGVINSDTDTTEQDDICD